MTFPSEEIFVMLKFFCITFYLDWLGLGSLQFSWPFQYTINFDVIPGKEQDMYSLMVESVRESESQVKVCRDIAES